MIEFWLWVGLQVDDKLEVNGLFVCDCVGSSPFGPEEGAALSAPAPSEADHEVSGSIQNRVHRTGEWDADRVVEFGVGLAVNCSGCEVR